MTANPGTLWNLLERAAGSGDLPGPGSEAGLRFVDRQERASWLGWRDLALRARRLARSLQGLGLTTGERVALVYPTGPEFFEAFFAVLGAGCVPVPLYPPVRLGRLDEYHRRTAALIESVDAALVLAEPRVRRILGQVVLLARPRLGCRALDELPDPGALTAPSGTAIAADDLALIQFSSGTTVEPKPVALSHRAVLAQVRSLNAHWPDRDGLRHSGVSWLPLYHDMGLIGCVFPALERPAELTLIGPEVFVSRPAIWLRTIARYRATISPAPNFAYALCVDKVHDQELDGVDLGCWRVALNGAEPVAAASLRAFQRRFGAWGFRAEALTPVYGLSEAALAVTFSSPERPFESRCFDRQRLATDGEALEHMGGRELVSVGRPLEGFELEIRDRDQVPLPADRVGRVWVRGPSMMAGYFGRPAATAEVFDRNGWLDTGDLGFVHEGELYLTGRAKDVLILRGRNHSPEDVENAVQTVPGVRTGCVVAVSHAFDSRASEELVVMVERRRAPAVDEATMTLECRRRILAGTGLEASRVVVLAPGTLPRTSSGKLRRAEALDRYLAATLEPPAATGWLRMARHLVRSRRAFARLGHSSAPADRSGRHLRDDS